MHRQQAIPPRAGRHAFAALILANMFLAFGPWMVRLADVGPVAAGFWRMMLAAPLLVALGAIGGVRQLRPERALMLIVIVGGLFFAADLAAWHYGITRTKLANATLFANSSSFLFPLYGFIVMRSLPKPMQLIALALALAGTALLLGNSYTISRDHLTGDLFALLAGLFYTCYLIAIDRVRRAMAPMPLLALSTAASILPLLLLALLLGEQMIPDNWTPLLLLAIGSQVIGQGLLIYAIGHISPVVVGLALLTQPAVTGLIGWLAYDERLGLTDAAGVLLICAAMVLIRLPDRVELRPA